MNKEAFIEDYKNIKKQDIIEELYYKCKANRDYYVEIERLNKELFDISEVNRKLFKENMELIKELKLYGGKLVITNAEVKDVWE